MKKSPLRIVQISDLHLFADKEEELLGVKTYESFSAVIESFISEKKPIDLLILSGDMSQDHSQQSYIHLIDILKKIHVPVYCIPGNHDDAKIMARLFPIENISNLRHIILNYWHIILLDSQKPDTIEGYLDRTQLHFLQHCLQMYPEHHALIVFHHHPILSGSMWLDEYRLLNADEFWDCLSPFSKVNTILFGHIHQVIEGKKNNIPYYSAPSTCIQFKKNQHEFSLEDLPPGYRWIDLYENGSVKTGIKRLANYIGVFDSNAKGYK